jgi:dTMP kinase
MATWSRPPWHSVPASVTNVIPEPGLIVFEGIDGSGKTTLSKQYVTLLQKQGISVTWLREPTDSSPSGRKIRELATRCERIPVEEELQYFLDDRRFDVRSHILPALKRREVVVMDRYFYSNACYQGARGLDMGEILAVNRSFAPEAIQVFVIDIDIDTALDRILRNRGTTAKLFENRDFLIQVRKNYLDLAGDHITFIDGLGDVLTVLQRIVTASRIKLPDLDANP